MLDLVFFLRKLDSPLFIVYRDEYTGTVGRPCMKVLSHLKLGTKLTLLLGLSAPADDFNRCGSLADESAMFDDRIDKLRAVVQSTVGFAQSLKLV